MNEKTNKEKIDGMMIEDEKTMKIKCKDCKHYVNKMCLDIDGNKKCWATIKKEEK